MTGEVIKSFLVGLGFDVDDSSLTKFNKAITNATIRVTALYATVKVAAAGIIYGISEISDSFEKLGYEYRLIAPTVNKTLQIRQETLRAYRSAGIDIIKVIQNSIRLNLSLTKTKIAFEAIYKSAASRFFTLLTKQSDTFRQKIYANMPKIIALVERFVKFVFRMSEALTAFGARVGSILGRVYDFFVDLDRVTNGWSTKILAVVAAWRILNLAFLATPLGALIVGIVALIELYDDFKVWKEGGESFFNWGSEAARIIVGLTSAIGLLAAAFYGMKIAAAAWSAVQAILNAELSFAAVAAAILEAPLYAIVAAVAAIVAGITLLDSKFRSLTGGHVADFFSRLGSQVMGILPSSLSLEAGKFGIPSSSGFVGPPVPLGVGGNQNSLTNQNVHQQTQINVHGSADAGAVGKAVAGEQNRVNFDAARNFQRASQ